MPAQPDPPAPRQGRAFGVPARRQQIVTLLSEAYARNDLEQEELERRLELAQKARTIEELDALIADFPVEIQGGYAGGGRVAAPSPAPGPGTVVSAEELQRQLASLEALSPPTRFSLLGDQNVELQPSEPRVLQTVSIIGDTRVDFRPLSGASGVFLLKVAALMGDTRISVPRDTRVESRLFTLIGSQKRTRRKEGLVGRLAKSFGGVAKPEAAPAPPGPTVVVTGFKLLGDLTIVED